MQKNFSSVSHFSRVLRAYWVHDEIARGSGFGPEGRTGLETQNDNPGTPGVKGKRSMQAKEELLKKSESSKDQAAAAELENKTQELKPEEAEKIAGGFNPVDGHH